MKFHLGKALLALLLLAIAPWAHAQDKGGAPMRSKAAAAPHTAADMTALYYDDANTTQCGKDRSNGPTLPAYFCSGIIIRAATPGTGYNSWNPSPGDEKDGGVSFSYIRKDSKFGQLVSGEASGFTLYPATGPYKYQGPDQKSPMNVVCAFPLDGWTDYRGAPIGCGAPNVTQYNITDGGKAGRMCQAQGISTAAQWLTHYQASTYTVAKLYQCGFDVSVGAPVPSIGRGQVNAADAFMQMIAAMKLVQAQVWADHNELRIGVWPTTWNKQLPIQSFFYIGADKGQGWTNARTDQKAYYDQTGEFVPVIKIKAPASESDDFSFHYYDDDQVVTPPAK